MQARVVAIICLMACLGCRSPNGCNPFGPAGTRIPPPPTGSYGSPNTYYQPSTSSAPATTPRPGMRAEVNPSDQWVSVKDDDNSVAVTTSRDPQPSERNDSTTGLQATSTASYEGTWKKASSSKSLSNQPSSSSDSRTARAPVSARLNGMRANEVRRPSEPALFVPEKEAGAIESSGAEIEDGSPSSAATTRSSQGSSAFQARRNPPSNRTAGL